VTDVADMPPVLTAAEVAAVLRVSKWSVYQSVKAGEIRAVHVGRTVRIARCEVERLLGEPSR
jgi:excisionase family DNA binding protein